MTTSKRLRFRRPARTESETAPKKLDLSRFGDPLAAKTEWRPASGGGTNFCTHRLAQTGPARMEFRPTTAARLFYFLFIVVGIALTIFGIGLGLHWFSGFKSKQGPWLPLMPTGFGVVFGGVGILLYRTGTRPIVFDKNIGFFWKGRTAPNEVFDWRTIKTAVDLNRVHALQILSEYCRGDKSWYMSYELNLVLDDGSRVNVVDHGNIEKLRADAGSLAAFLEVPVWDAA